MRILNYTSYFEAVTLFMRNLFRVRLPYLLLIRRVFRIINKINTRKYFLIDLRRVIKLVSFMLAASELRHSLIDFDNCFFYLKEYTSTYGLVL
jgi:hypothetical protein